ncbi:MAG: preprotein translocase subunit SecG [Candidatus Jacksonbacteria bacterium RIFCSPLOWO2_02_FULL_43_9]|nr:MAG: Preprotein translocase, SecG subunit [Parcubacteria group bacterium GW2011_GWA2_43_13]OGY69466.1 MAG: preprotein translocase subunit SecG [Candidatus Jacksonbacteria bacterium RIFCSPHIGHO2_02_FULL_43_10]OGY71347.1 MAG: preprotein translocase subunit SecG [Candidatus Jacksonbacteria bacterium RIFCSPLOWO2_01_FULL_44_13]OGY74348.1 MAG: preprotein translocase subunit SecG [Candidatus Jacksonbacteria bacterium RIFCSPLOWO2_02_FULL_43_9]HAZ17028.1 preprotein translocase subunit SecG [Candidatu
MKWLYIAQIILSGLLVGSILLQSRGAGLGEVFGGGGTVFRTKRGAEKVLFIATTVIAVLFAGSAFASLFLA